MVRKHRDTVVHCADANESVYEHVILGCETFGLPCPCGGGILPGSVFRICSNQLTDGVPLMCLAPTEMSGQSMPKIILSVVNVTSCILPAHRSAFMFGFL